MNNLNKRIINNIAIVNSETPIITDSQSAIDLMMTVLHYDNINRLVINKQAIIKDFFIISTSIAGDILQKFINYQVKLAIYGDFSKYTSKPLKDFMLECNKGENIFFVDNEESAIDKLSK